MKLPLFHVDAFTSRPFGGNPAAVCPLEGDTWLDDATLQSIAAENNLSETAFVMGRGGEYQLRWFTPRLEIDLCGHATLGTAYVIFNRLETGLTHASFKTRSGTLTVAGDGDTLWLDFPSRPPQSVQPPANLSAGLGAQPQETLAARDYLFVFGSEEEVAALRPDFRILARWERMVIVTAPGRSVDFVSRFFAPTSGIDEDPVTGSAHCTLIPYWAKRLGKDRLEARQVSERIGELRCELRGERVRIGGSVRPYLEGTIEL